MITLPIIYMVLALTFPETPHYLLRKGRTEDAKAAMKFYKNSKGADKDGMHKFEEEFNILKEAIVSKHDSGSVTISDFCKSI